MKKQTIMILTICFIVFLMPGCGTKDSGVSPDLKQGNVSKNKSDRDYISKGQKHSKRAGDQQGHLTFKKHVPTKPYGSDRFGKL